MPISDLLKNATKHKDFNTCKDSEINFYRNWFQSKLNIKHNPKKAPINNGNPQNHKWTS